MKSKYSSKTLFLLLLIPLLSLLMFYATGDAEDTWKGSNVGIAAGKEHSVALCSDGTVWAWGDNSYGQLGDGTIQDSKKPVRIKGLDEVIAVAAGDYHTLALRSDGIVWAWGDNSYHQLGIKKDQLDVQTLASSKPVQVRQLNKVTAIAAGARHSLALRADNTVRAWGDNSYGQLGNGTKENSEAVRQVFFLDRAGAISAAGFSSAALLIDGTVRTWGANQHGHLGNGRRTGTQLQPGRVEDLGAVTAIAMGTGHLVVLKEEGAVWAWGGNESGQTGDGTRIDRLRPTKVMNVKDAVSIAAGELHTLAIGKGGAVWAWGDNSYGQIGDGTAFKRPVPVMLKELGQREIICVAAGDEHSLALDAEGTIWAWGSNWSGCLGNGTTEPSNTPVKTMLNVYGKK